MCTSACLSSHPPALPRAAHLPRREHLLAHTHVCDGAAARARVFRSDDDSSFSALAFRLNEGAIHHSQEASESFGGCGFGSPESL